MLKYLRGKYPNPVVPTDTPVWFHYEVNFIEDNVLRTVEIFSNGTHVRNSLALENRYGYPYPCVSLVDGPFMELAADWSLEEISALDFEKLWEISADKPFHG